MNTKIAYKGYKAYSYLKEGRDYRKFELAKEVDRVKPYIIPLNYDQEITFREFVKNNLIISLHDHPVVIPDNINELMEYEKTGKEHTAYEGMANSYIDVVFDNMMDGTCVISSEAGWKWVDIIHDIGMRSCDIAHQDFVVKSYGIEDIYRVKSEGKIAWFIALESSTMIENEVDRLDILYGLGVRMMGITYSESNSLGSGLKEKRDGGLTSFGRKAVERMNTLGIAIDVSHSGVQTALDTIEHSEKPVFITHTGARSLWDMNRLMPDEVFIACAEKGGVIGIEAAPHTTVTKAHKSHSIESYMEHFEYVKNLVGIDHVAFGPDALYGDHVGLHNMFSANMSISEGTKSNDTEYDSIEYVKGMENPSEAMTNIIRWLIKNNYAEEDMKKVLGTNIMRVLKQVWSR